MAEFQYLVLALLIAMGTAKVIIIRSEDSSKDNLHDTIHKRDGSHKTNENAVKRKVIIQEADDVDHKLERGLIGKKGFSGDCVYNDKPLRMWLDRIASDDCLHELFCEYGDIQRKILCPKMACSGGMSPVNYRAAPTKYPQCTCVTFDCL